MKLVADNSEADLERARTARLVSAAIRELTANLIRITRGAGKADDVVGQLSRVNQAIADYQEAHGYAPGPEFSEMLSLEGLEPGQELSVDAKMDRYAMLTAVRGGLQVTASSLLAQTTQIRNGTSELYAGVNQILKQREDYRQERAAGASVDALVALAGATAARKPRKKNRNRSRGD